MKTVVFLAITAVSLPALAQLPLSIDGSSLETIHTFSGLDGRWPISGLVQDRSGRLYGASRFGGPADAGGTLFSALPDGSEFHLIHTFTNLPWRPNGLMLSTNGRLYGTLDEGLSAFEMNKDGGGYRVLRSVPFSDQARALVGPLVEGSGGILLGEVEGFGGYGGGGIGRMNKDGTGFTETAHLLTTSFHPAYLQPPLAPGQDGRFFGVSGMANQQFGVYSDAFGTFFSVQSDGSDLQTLLDLGALGWGPTSPVMAGSDGKFYGAARSDDVSSSIVWRANSDGSGFTILKQFRCAQEGSVGGQLLEGTDGRIYGTTSFGSGPLCNVPFQFLITALFSINRDGSNYAREWEEVYRDSAPNVIASLRLFLRGQDGALYGASQSPPGALVRFQPAAPPTSPHVISCQPDMVAPEGSRVVLAPAVRGAGPLFYQWTQNGARMIGATNAWLGIDNVQPTNYGTYRVTVTNQFGASSCSFAFTAPTPLKLSPPHPLPHDMELHVRGSGNLPFGIECSSDLKTWIFVAGGELVDGRAVVSISASSIGEHRFFRARYAPIGLPER